MAGNSNVTCAPPIDNFAFVDASDSLKTFSIAQVIFTTIYVISTLIWWYSRKNHPYLLKRSFALVTLSGCGVLIEALSSSLRRALPDTYPCALFGILLPASFIIAYWPLTVRLILFFNRIKYDETLVDLLSQKEGYNFDFQSILKEKDLRKRRFRASNLFGAILTIGVIAIVIAILSISNSLICSCRVEPNRPIGVSLLLLLILGYIVTINLYVVFVTSGRPDPLFIRRETKWAWLVGTLCFSISLLLVFIDPGNFTEQSNADWHWFILLDFTFIAVYTVSVPISVYSTYTKLSKFEDSELEDILNNDIGLKCFGRYLATELSLENLLFYEEAREWENSTYESEEKRQEKGRSIYEKYFMPGSDFEINISSSVSKDVHQVFASAQNVSKDTFLPARQEVFRLMKADSFFRFRKSKFYELYLGYLTPKEEDGVMQSKI